MRWTWTTATASFRSTVSLSTLRNLYHVALPRNLCKGLFNIKPLVTWAEATDLPAEDDFVPAMNCVLLRHSYALWRRLGEFDDIDTNHDGVITVDEVRDARATARRRAPKILLDNVMEARRRGPLG